MAKVIRSLTTKLKKHSWKVAVDRYGIQESQISGILAVPDSDSVFAFLLQLLGEGGQLCPGSLMPLCCFRNLSGVDPDTAEEMVKQDVMTSLTGYFQVVAEPLKLTLFRKCLPMVFKQIHIRVRLYTEVLFRCGSELRCRIRLLGCHIKIGQIKIRIFCHKKMLYVYIYTGYLNK